MTENNQILQLLQSKSSTKQEVFRTTLAAFKKLTNSLEKKASKLGFSSLYNYFEDKILKER